MMNIKTREAFCLKKSLHINVDDPQYLKLKDYILSDECVKDIKRLEKGDYFLGIPRRFKIKKMNTAKHRICYKFDDKDNYILKLMSYVLLDYDSIYTKSLYSFRKNYNHTAFFDKLKRKDFGRKTYVLKMDVHSYGDSVDQDILLDLCKPLFENEPQFYKFLTWLLKRNQYYENGVLHNERVSIICGTPIGSFLNNIYLMELDEYLIKHSKLCMRYADDIAVFLPTLEEAENMRDFVLNFLKNRKLTCNPEKTEIYKPGETFSILGLKISPYEFDLAPSSVSKLYFKLKKKQRQLLRRVRNKTKCTEAAFKIGYKYMQIIFYGRKNRPNDTNWAAWSFGTITTAKTLKEIDVVCENFLRSLATGKTSKARYRVRYDYLKKSGFIPLVHRYYHNRNEKNLNV